MAGKIYPLAFKPGIKRDGIEFQGEYCTDGRWVRWIRGNVRKIGGMLSFSGQDGNIIANNMLIIPTTNANSLIIGSASSLTTYRFTDNMVVQGDRRDTNAANKQWYFLALTNVAINAQGVVVVKEPILLALGANSSMKNSDAVSVLYTSSITEQILAPVINNSIAGIINANADGGMCFANPYLFFYGSYGTVKIKNTKANGSVGLVEGVDYYTTNTIGNDNSKVIYGTQIRGSAVTILFWTTTSVIRYIFESQVANGKTVQFKQDIVTQSSSIISPRCVVEYDNVFFWVGTDRFYLYNGIVQELANTMNLNFFFDNVDMTRQMQIFGVKNMLYGEIWWFYPVKGVNGANSHAIIYNVRENTWYDTEISRDAGMLYEQNGNMYSWGGKLENPQPTRRTLWQQEAGVAQNFNNDILPIQSYFVTPAFGWPSFNPLKQPTGEDKWTMCYRWEPTIKVLLNIAGNEYNNATFAIQAKKYPNEVFAEIATTTFTSTTNKLDFQVQGRQMRFKVTFSGYWEYGTSFMLLDVGASQ